MTTRVRSIAVTTAAVVGVSLGSYGIAAATSAPSETDPAPGTEVEEVDGIDHQFEGEEIGENGDGIPGPDEATEAEEAEADGVDDDDVQHESEHEGENDPDEGNED